MASDARVTSPGERGDQMPDPEADRCTCGPNQHHLDAGALPGLASDPALRDPSANSATSVQKMLEISAGAISGTNTYGHTGTAAAPM